MASALCACVTSDVRVCGDIVCPGILVCAPAEDTCVAPEQVTACEGRDEGQTCTLAGIGDGACRREVCVVAGCGDRIVDAGEQCDDGNDVDDDACTNACTLPVCGDGVVQGGEACDLGAANGDDRACTSRCRLATCGDGFVQAGVEACDLGAGNADSSACTSACTSNVCGDGKTWLGVEGCDDGNAVDDDACRTTCALPRCGDGIEQSGEGCDDGAGNGDDRACTLSCQNNVCGDGRQLLGVEACDDGVANADGAACTLACATATCGDGHTWAGVELCDDGNTDSGDGCRSDCRKIETCGDGTLDASEACDDGNEGAANPADGCDACRTTAWQAFAVLGVQQLGTEIGLSYPMAIAADLEGNLFIADSDNHTVRRWAATTGVTTTVAGTGEPGFSGDGGAATSARLNHPEAVAVDGAGNVFIADTYNNRIRRIAATSGVITTIAGTGAYGFGGDGGAASGGQLASPGGVTVDGSGDIFVADSGNHRIRRIAHQTALITTFAGTGSPGFGGDGTTATNAQLYFPRSVVVDAAGALFVADTFNHRVRKIAGSAQLITTIAGTGVQGSSGDGAAATSAQLAFPAGLVVDPFGNLVVADLLNHRVRKVEATTGRITTIAGTGARGFAGDGGQATAAQLAFPQGVAMDAEHNLFVADRDNHRVRRIAAATTVVATVVGDGTRGFAGDGGSAVSARLSDPWGVAVDQVGNVFVADRQQHRVRKIAAHTGVISTVAGTGTPGAAGDGGPASDAQLNLPEGVAVDSGGNLFIADSFNSRIRRVDATTGIISTVAGTGVAGFSGDHGDALQAQLAYPSGLAVDRDDHLFIADAGNARVRRWDTASHVITTVAGNGVAGFGGDGGDATGAQLSTPSGVALGPNDDLVIADRGDHRVRRVERATGVITTIAGTGAMGFSGDGGLGTSAQLGYPESVAFDATGGVLIADTWNLRVRRIDPATGVITTVVGNVLQGSAGDGGPAAAARLDLPRGLALDDNSALFIACWGSDRVRRVEPSSGNITTVAGAVAPEGMGPLSQARLADPRGLVLAPTLSIIAGGSTGTLQGLRPNAQTLEVVAGRYPHEQATAQLAKFRDPTFGTIGGVAYDAALARIYLTDTSAHRLHVVTISDVDDEDTWTLATLAGDALTPSGTAGFADGPALTARFDSPMGLFFDESSRVLYVADAGNHVIRALSIDAAGAPGDVRTVAGTPRVLGIFGDSGAATDALLYGPSAVTRCDNGDLFVADTTNQRVRRIEAGSGVISTVLGDGVAASSGQGSPASTFPVDTPRGLACDSFGNLYVSSRTAMRLLVANASGVVDGAGAVQTIYGAAPRTEYPSSVTSCLTGVAAVDGETVQFTDACTGVLGELWRQPLP